MSIKLKRGIFLGLIALACLVGAVWNHPSAVQVSMMMVIQPIFMYWMLRMFSPAFRMVDQPSMYIRNLSPAEKVEGGLMVLGIFMLLLIWSMRIFV